MCGDHTFDGFMATGGGHDVCIEGAVSFGMPGKMQLHKYYNV